jgi:SAM-dependent methyltransferase
MFENQFDSSITPVCIAMLEVIADELKKIARSPKRLLQAFRPRRWRQFLGILAFNARGGNRWQTAPAQPEFKRREYSSYEEYVRHQQSKFGFLDLADYDVNYRRQLRERLRTLALPRPAATVLCLGARQGTEVKAFQDLGCFAVGLDLNPGPENEFVLHGDFHRVRFPDRSVDVIFTNSFDHVFDPAKLIGEITRLLKPGGLLIIEAIQGEAQDIAPDHYASFWWRRIDDLVALLARHGFQPARRVAFREPWPGEQICFAWQAPGNV